MLAKKRNRSLIAAGSEFSSRPRLLVGVVHHCCTIDVTVHVLSPGVLSTTRVSAAAAMSACPSGMLLKQQVLAVHPVVPLKVNPVALAMTGFLLMIRCAVIVYPVSAMVSLSVSDRWSVAACTVAPVGIDVRSNFMTIALAT